MMMDLPWDGRNENEDLAILQYHKYLYYYPLEHSDVIVRFLHFVVHWILDITKDVTLVSLDNW